MASASASPEAVIFAAILGATGVVVVGLIQGIFLFLNSTTQRRHERRQSAREARRDRLKTQADAVEKCIDAAVRLRMTADAYKWSDLDSERALSKAETKLEAAMHRISDPEARDKVQAWKQMTRESLQGPLSAASLHRAWEEAIQTLGHGWSMELTKSEQAFEDDEPGNRPPLSWADHFVAGALTIIFSAFLTTLGHDFWHLPFIAAWVILGLPIVALVAWYCLRGKLKP